MPGRAEGSDALTFCGKIFGCRNAPPYRYFFVTFVTASPSASIYMKKLVTLSLAAGLLAMMPVVAHADSSTNSTSSATTQTPDAKKKHQAEQRQKIMAILKIDRKDLKGLSKEDRQAKIKEAADQMIADLEKRKADGAITAQEQTDLDTLKKFVQHAKAAKKSDS
jgi:hypothetical protein